MMTEEAEKNLIDSSKKTIKQKKQEIAECTKDNCFGCYYILSESHEKAFCDKKRIDFVKFGKPDAEFWNDKNRDLLIFNYIFDGETFDNLIEIGDEEINSYIEQLKKEMSI